jgi:hypothetical protein
LALTQASPAAHGVPQPPQFDVLFEKSAQLLSHGSDPGGHVFEHCPPEHTSVPSHTFPHFPQFCPLLIRLTHSPLQSVDPFGQSLVHSPFTHTNDVGHSFPQRPQLCGSSERYVHCPSHFRCAELHGQLSPLHVFPPDDDPVVVCFSPFGLQLSAQRTATHRTSTTPLALELTQAPLDEGVRPSP